MVIDLKMCRFESCPWGFRLIGGSDYEMPLTVVKVTEGSIAELAGMKVGDIIVRINDDAASQLSHNDAHEVISKCGNNFFFGVMRESEIDSIEDEQVMEKHHQSTVSTIYEEASHQECSNMDDISKSPVPEVPEKCGNDLTEICQQNIEGSANHQQEKLSDEDIAELISSEAEVLKDHNVIGIFPKPGVCMSSQVLRQLNDEAIKTKIEREKEKRKWTTFMQKPDRPVPKSRRELEEEKAKQVNTYKVVITKQPKPRVAPDHVPTPPPTPEPESLQQVPEEEDEEEMKPLADSELPDLEPLTTEDIANDESPEMTDNLQIGGGGGVVEDDLEETNPIDEEVTEPEEEPEAEIVQKTEEELILEQQLADVQKQLLALSSLPSTIQATLDAVTKQLAELLPTFRLQQPSEIEVTPQEEINEVSPCEDTILDNQEVGNEDNEDLSTDLEANQTKIVAPEETAEQQLEDEFVVSSAEEDLQQAQQNEEERKISEELNYKKQKDNNNNGLMEELQERFNNNERRNTSTRRSSRPFGPLVPQQRPLILPGGRRWRTPKDAFNEDFIAETLTSQAELIVGHTLGSTFESPLLGYDQREYNSTSLALQLQRKVNFLKYQKPEKKIDLGKSEVYKVIHHLDRQPKHGIEMRPPKVMAEEDIRNRVNTPISCG